MENSPFSFRARAKSFKYAFRGLKRLIIDEHNARIHCCATIAVVTAGVLFHISALEWVAVVICIVAVIAAEAFNSAIEALADKVTREQDPLIGKAKDIASAGVLILAIGSVVVASIIFIPKIITLL